MLVNATNVNVILYRYIGTYRYYIGTLRVYNIIIYKRSRQIYSGKCDLCKKKYELHYLWSDESLRRYADIEFYIYWHVLPAYPVNHSVE